MRLECPQPQRDGDAFVGQLEGVSRFTPSFTPYKVKRLPSPYASQRRVSTQVPVKKILLIIGSAILLAVMITLLCLVVPKRPTVWVKRVSVPSTSHYNIAASGNIITVDGHGTLSIRLHNPNLLQRQHVKDLQVQVFWVGYQGDDADHYDTAPLATGQLQQPLTLYPKDTMDTTIKTSFEHTGTHNVDPIWLDFIRRCLNQDAESRHLRLVFRVEAVVRTGVWGEGRRRWVVPQELPCPMTTGQIVELFKSMQLPPPKQAQVN